MNVPVCTFQCVMSAGCECSFVFWREPDLKHVVVPVKACVWPEGTTVEEKHSLSRSTRIKLGPYVLTYVGRGRYYGQLNGLDQRTRKL